MSPGPVDTFQPISPHPTLDYISRTVDVHLTSETKSHLLLTANPYPPPNLPENILCAAFDFPSSFLVILNEYSLDLALSTLS